MAHMFMYAGFAFACLWGYREQFVSRGLAYKKKAIILALIIGIAYGGLTELMQKFFVEGRKGDWIDFLADSLGTGLGVLIFYLFFKRKK